MKRPIYLSGKGKLNISSRGKVSGSGLFQSLGRKINNATAYGEHAVKSGAHAFIKEHGTQLMENAKQNTNHEIKKQGAKLASSKLNKTLGLEPAVNGEGILLNKLSMTPKFLTKNQNRNNIKLII